MGTTTQSNPLHADHTARNAEFQSYGDLEIVSTFGEPQAEYAAIHKATALMDLPQRAILEFTGKDRHAFLNNLITNQTWDKNTKQPLTAGQGVYAFLINTKGRIVTDLNIIELGDRAMVELDGRVAPLIETMLTKYVFAEQVKITSRTGELHRLAIHGPGAASLLADAGTDPTPLPALAELADMGSVELTLMGVPTILYRDDVCGVPGYQLIIPTSRAAELWQAILERFASPLELGKRRLRPIGWAAFNSCRIEAARPLFDIDFGNSLEPDKSTLPAETGQLFARAVSVTKGCYLGQEVVARMHARGQVARQLVGLRVADDALPIAGAPILEAASENQIGMVTSSTMSPLLSDAAIALAMIKKPFFAIGTEVRVPAEGAMQKATVVALPFL